MYLSIYVSQVEYVSMYVSMYASIYVSIYVWISLSIYLCMCVSMYVSVGKNGVCLSDMGIECKSNRMNRGKKNKYQASVAEWSKALVSGTSLFGGVGSNPTSCILIKGKVRKV